MKGKQTHTQVLCLECVEVYWTHRDGSPDECTRFGCSGTCFVEVDKKTGLAAPNRIVLKAISIYRLMGGVEQYNFSINGVPDGQSLSHDPGGKIKEFLKEYQELQKKSQEKYVSV